MRITLLTAYLLTLPNALVAADLWNEYRLTPTGSTLFSLFQQAGFSPDDSSPVLSYSCDLNKRTLPGIDLSATRTMSSANNSPKLSFDLSQPTGSMKDFFELFAKTSVGEPMARQLKSKYEFGDIEILFISQQERSRVPPNVIAFCECAKQKKTLYVDKFIASGLLAPTFFHEIAHALDPEVFPSFKSFNKLFVAFQKKAHTLLLQTAKDKSKPLTQLSHSDVSRDKLQALWLEKEKVQAYLHTRSFRLERLAYDYEHAISLQLVRLFPKYYRGKGQRALSHLRKRTDEQIIKGYGLKPSVISRYQQGKCEAFR